MPYGITNAKIISGGSGGGDTVYAVSETALNKDDKVYLNKHYYDSYEAESFSSGWNNSAHSKYVYCYNNGDLITFNNSKYCSHYPYDSNNKTWVVREFEGKTDGGTLVGVENLDGTIVTRTTKAFNSVGDQFIFQTRTVNITGKILRKDLALQYAASKQFKLVEIVNPETGELGQTYSTVNYGIGNYIHTAKLIGNILFFTCSGGEYCFYDISDVTAPILLKSGTSAIDTITAVTGLTAGDYVFGVDGVNNYLTASQLTYCYKIAEDYSLRTADDLPPEFYSYLSQAHATYYFNPENNTLAIGNNTSVSLYKYKDKTFKKINYSIPIPTEFTLYAGYGYILFVSEDLSTAVIAGRRGGSQPPADSKRYKMVNNNDNWYAEDYTHSNALSLQGFATGKTNDKGEYEVSTVLPAKVNLTINTNVDTVIEMRGDVE